jgi:murein DD-endopeptidase MepM/ murein hydrolase activator NlpD
MIRIITIIVFILITNFKSFAQIKLFTFSEIKENGYNFFANNEEFCPVSIKIDFELNNLISTNGNGVVFVVPARTKKFLLTSLNLINKNNTYAFKNTSFFNYGDVTLTEYNNSFIYSLPFETGKSYKVHQGYNGNFSHQNENAIDFTMPIGTKIFSSRAGIVVKVVQNFNENCPEKECVKYNNYIIVFHDDGTFSRYDHLKRNGSVVKEGEAIIENQLIGYSGNTGFSSGPHLHFMVFIQRLKSTESLKTKFKINYGLKNDFLIEKETYLKNN